jgi:hypothetical protein
MRLVRRLLWLGLLLFPLPVSAANGASILSVSVPASVTPGASFSATVTAQNTGSTTWTDPGFGVQGSYHLGSQAPQDNTLWGMARVHLPAAIPPGQTGTFVWTVTAPLSTGLYTFSWRMVQDYVEWFGTAGSATVSVQAQQNGGGGTYVVPGFQQEVRPVPPDPGDGSLVGDVILNTGVYNISQTWDVHTLDWTNTTGRTLLLRESALWTGVDKDAIADVGLYAVRVRDNALIMWEPWDHYANPVAPDQLKSRSHSPAMVLLPNDVIRLYYVAAWGGATGHAAHILEIRVTYQP